MATNVLHDHEQTCERDREDQLPFQLEAVASLSRITRGHGHELVNKNTVLIPP